MWGIAANLLISAGGDVLSPKVTYGEFPFRLEYETNGENAIIELMKELDNCLPISYWHG